MELFAKNLEEIRLLFEDPYLHVYDITHEALRQISLNREESTKQIEESTSKQFDEVEAFRKECKINIESKDFKQLFQIQIKSFDSLKSLFQEPTCVESSLNLVNNRCRNLISSIKTILLNGKSFILYPGCVPQTKEIKIENLYLSCIFLIFK